MGKVRIYFGCWCWAIFARSSWTKIDCCVVSGCREGPAGAIFAVSLFGASRLFGKIGFCGDLVESIECGIRLVDGDGLMVTARFEGFGRSAAISGRRLSFDDPCKIFLNVNYLIMKWSYLDNCYKNLVSNFEIETLYDFLSGWDNGR